MSVIYGKYNFTAAPVTPNELSLMESKLNHWNADDTGTWLDKAIGLGHLMFYNTPESLHEKLPLHKNGLTITADARVDNRDEIYPLLNLDNNCTLPDSTLILMLYEKYGEAFMKHLIGDFTFAIWDEQKQHLFCARDHMGIKPFFYYRDDNFFAFASELKGLLCIPDIDKSINIQFLYNQMFRNSDQLSSTTLYKNIQRLSPAHTLVMRPGNATLQLNQYWELDADAEIKFDTQEAYYDAFRQHFETAVKCRLRSAYPVGIELSGGMDSSGITGVASHFLRQEGKNVTTISNTIPKHVTDEEQLSKSERTWIDAVVEFNHIENAVITISDPPADPFEEIDFMLYVNDGLDTWQQQWQVPIRKAAQKEGVRALLSGFPGDEMVTYRGKYYYLDYLDKKQYIKYLFSKRKFPGFHKLDPLVPYGIRYSLHVIKNALRLYNKHIKTARKMFNIPPDVVNKKGDISWRDPLVVNQFKSYRHYQKQRFLRYHLPARMESETRYGLYFRLEPRFPMADIRLTQYYLSMPNYLKYEGTLHRTAYRKAMARYMPQAVLERDNKTGGMAPYREPIKDEELVKTKIERAKAMMEEMFAALEGNPFIKPKALKERRLNMPIFRWLQKYWDGKVE